MKITIISNWKEQFDLKQSNFERKIIRRRNS